MVLAMLLGGPCRCEVLGLRLADVRVADRSLFVAEGKGGHERVVPVANAFFIAVGDYLRDERPATSQIDSVAVVAGRRRDLSALRRRGATRPVCLTGQFDEFAEDGAQGCCFNLVGWHRGGRCPP